jgi:class 3 adenylate cyclase
MAEQNVERRLAAVLAADVVGYSRMMAADEEGTLARLNSCRRELWEPTIAEHRGRVVKRTGDGMLVEFGSATRPKTRRVMNTLAGTKPLFGEAPNGRVLRRAYCPSTRETPTFIKPIFYSAIY